MTGRRPGLAYFPSPAFYDRPLEPDLKICLQCPVSRGLMITVKQWTSMLGTIRQHRKQSGQKASGSTSLSAACISVCFLFVYSLCQPEYLFDFRSRRYALTHPSLLLLFPPSRMIFKTPAKLSGTTPCEFPFIFLISNLLLALMPLAAISRCMGHASAYSASITERLVSSKLLCIVGPLTPLSTGV